MALTRKLLEAMGIEDAKVQQIIEEHSETVEALKRQRDEFKAQADKLPEMERRIQELEGREGAEELQAKYEELETEFADYKGKVESERMRAQREGLYRNLLLDAGIDEKRIKPILKVTDLDALEVDAKGALKGADKLKAQAVEEWSDFISKTETRGASTDTPPANVGGGMTKGQIMAIKDAGERQRAIAENHELFGF